MLEVYDVTKWIGPSLGKWAALGKTKWVPSDHMRRLVFSPNTITVWTVHHPSTSLLVQPNVF